MPLRVAEKEGYLHAVNRCGDCPFGEFGMIKIEKPRFYCEHEQGKIEEKISGNSIPVWCPLPEEKKKTPLRELVDFLKVSTKRGFLTEEQFKKILGSHYQDPEYINIVESSEEPTKGAE